MTDTVKHWHSPGRNLFGQAVIRPSTSIWSGSGISEIPGIGFSSDHRARVLHTVGAIIGPASRDDIRYPTATVWLIDHPHSVAVNDTFELPGNTVLKVIRSERRQLPDGVLTKVYLT